MLIAGSHGLDRNIRSVFLAAQDVRWLLLKRHPTGSAHYPRSGHSNAVHGYVPGIDVPPFDDNSTAVIGLLAVGSKVEGTNHLPRARRSGRPARR
jgi:hypothetical protein